MKEKVTVALIYDFDKTLAVLDMATFKFIPDLGLEENAFWDKTTVFADKYHCERVLSYLYVMIDEARKGNHIKQRISVVRE